MSTSSTGTPRTAAHLLDVRLRPRPLGTRRARRRLASCAIDGRRIGYSRRAEPGRRALGRARRRVVLECSGRFRTREQLDAVLRAGRAQGRSSPRRSRTTRAQRRHRRERRSLRPERARRLTAASCTTNCLAPVVKVIHEGIGIRHGVDHHPPRHDQHADRRRRAAQGSAARARRAALADPDHDRLGDGDRPDLSRSSRASSTGSRCACRCSTHRSPTASSRSRGRPRSRRSTGCSSAPRTGRSPASSASRSGRSSRSTTRTTRARRSSTRSRRW